MDMRLPLGWSGGSEDALGLAEYVGTPTVYVY